MLSTLSVFSPSSKPYSISFFRKNSGIRTIACFEVSNDFDATNFSNQVRTSSIQMLSAPDVCNFFIIRAKVIPILAEWTFAPVKDIKPIKILESIA